MLGMASHNGTRAAISRAPSREEAAAIIATVERFRRATTPPVGPAATDVEGWQSAALTEGVERSPGGDLRDPWINT
jgi:hypothetical protein